MTKTLFNQSSFIPIKQKSQTRALSRTRPWNRVIFKSKVVSIVLI